MRLALFTLFLVGILCTDSAAQIISGKVISAINGQPLAGAGLTLINNKTQAGTGTDGSFSMMAAKLPDTLLITYLGHKRLKVSVSGKQLNLGVIKIAADHTDLAEVKVNTGYYQIAKERATGSFTQVDNKLLNRSVGANIMDRLEGVTSGLQFDRRNMVGENKTAKPVELRVRGLSTIAGSAAPLIIVDNFPYPGDINSINPNDVESITVLKDAAAASIWGARAGNGVIVINTKQGQFNQPARIAFNTNVNITGKPDLYYDKNYLPSETVMGIQKELFDRKAYVEDDKNYIPAYVELLIKRREGKVTEGEFLARESVMKETDFREQASRYLYQTGINQQYALSVNGGSAAYKYYLSGGYDKNKANQVGNSNDRMNLNFQNTFKLNKDLELSASIWYSQQKAESSSVTYTDMALGVREPYSLLADADGNALPVGYGLKRLAYTEEAIDNGLLDWLYRPLEEQKLNSNIAKDKEIRINGGLKYRFLNHFNLNTTYQYLQGSSQSEAFHDAGSYYTRDLVNRFTQANGQQIIPNGGILEGSGLNEYKGISGRVQMNYDQTFADQHQFTALAGAEVGAQVVESRPGYRFYNYSKDFLGGTPMFDYTKYFPVRPSGSALIPQPPGLVRKGNDRNLSYFSNAAYSYDGKYTLSGSARWDGSNLFGVKTNQRGTVLWSAGAGWEMSKEQFYGISSWLPYLRLRATYGSGGLIDKSQSHYPSIYFTMDSKTGFPIAKLSHPGNPNLGWEQVNTLNLGLDWSIKGQRLTGSFEWYNKDANHLLGSIKIDPTTGAEANYKQNYADMTTKGFDLQINSINMRLPMKWTSHLLINYSRNKIRNYSTPAAQNSYDYFGGVNKPPVAGHSVDALYALPWNGLNPQTGQPLIYIDSKQSTDYASYLTNFKPENLINAGVEVAPLTGSLRNSFSWKGMELSTLISFKTGYVFRRASMKPGAEYNVSTKAILHVDYYNRWQKPGDEKYTNVPGATSTENTYAGSAYRESMALVTSGDHIRLQDINLSYTLSPKITKSLAVQQLRFYVYARNLGIIWRANKYDIDPDYPYATYPAPKTLAFGLQIGL